MFRERDELPHIRGEEEESLSLRTLQRCVDFSRPPLITRVYTDALSELSTRGC